MPDFFGIAVRALADVKVNLEPTICQMDMKGTQDDSTRAARMMKDLGAGCIVTLGGDGTNRAVAKGSGQTPLLPISTGTNNVFPTMVEGTLAGMAAGVAALNHAGEKTFIRQAPKLEIRLNEQPVDLALIDVAVSAAGFIATRALWRTDTLREIFLARAESHNIGFSAIGGHLYRLPPDCGKGVHIVVGEGNGRVKAPIAPGLVRSVPIKTHRVFGPGEIIPIGRAPAMIALDGERELTVKKNEMLTVNLNLKGPQVVDIGAALKQAASQGAFWEP